jgi:hypothetical protein
MTLGVPQIRFWIWTSLTLIIGIVIMVISNNNLKKAVQSYNE